MEKESIQDALSEEIEDLANQREQLRVEGNLQSGSVSSEIICSLK